MSRACPHGYHPEEDCTRCLLGEVVDLRTRLADTEEERDEARADAARKGEALRAEQLKCGGWNSCDWEDGKCRRCGISASRRAEIDAALSDTSASEAACGFREDAHQCNLRRGHNGACKP